MIKLITKILLLIALVLGVSLIVRKSMNLPMGWMNTSISLKDITLKERNKEINTLFLGTSRVEYHLKPSAFDFHMQKLSSIKTKSFNFGISGSNINEMYRLLDELIVESDEHLKYIMIELPTIEEVLTVSFFQNMHTERAKYWCNFSDFWWGVKTTWQIPDERYTLAKKVKIMFYYGVTYIENIFNVSLLQGMIKYKLYPPLNKKKLGKKQNGYRALDNTTHTQKNRDKFLEDPQKYIAPKLNASIAAFKVEVHQKAPYNQQHLDRIHHLIELSKQHNKELFFFFPPYLPIIVYNELKPLYDQIPDAHKIELNNANEYPEFYKEENLWDKGHLNESGSGLLTQKLAEKFTDLTNSRIAPNYPYRSRGKKQKKNKQKETSKK